MEKLSGVLHSCGQLSAQLNSSVVRIGGSDSSSFYVKTFSPSDFSQNGLRFQLHLPAAAHNLGYQWIVAEVVREKQGKYGTIDYQIHRLPNGDALMYSHDAFRGQIVLQSI
ncbi:hypothetical protein [Youxingia wuxianensis]|uniref:Uncharacterized protein n=1 Tax=Youxingia wuxianensis TaxID=2763678 RepID=A0A926IIC8_9FIRM|nr:hypothetical protein [Youxingia wuxianensis]MBC8585553.1 hypothetical protein [Youxingia wuxianensis]